MTAILKRELGAYFASPIGYAVTAAFMFFSGMFFNYYCLVSGTSSMYGVFQGMFSIILFLIPLITMRSFAEERRNKTDQILYTSPVSIPSVVIAKYLSAMVLLLICLSSYLIEGLVLSMFGSPDWSVIIGNILGMLMLGSAFISINLLISSLTESVMVAAVFSFAVNYLISLTDTVRATVNWQLLSDTLGAVSFQMRYDNFELGIIKLSDVVFFVTVTALFLFLTDRVIEKKRWS